MNKLSIVLLAIILCLTQLLIIGSFTTSKSEAIQQLKNNGFVDITGKDLIYTPYEEILSTKELASLESMSSTYNIIILCNN